MSKILVFIPVYNCERQITRVLAAFENQAAASYFSEVLVLDNNSKDNSVIAAQHAAARIAYTKVTVARNKENYNLGGSIKSAFSYAIRTGFTHVVILHGDDQGDIADLLPLLESGEYNQYDCCLGARFAPGSTLAGYSRFLTIGNHVFNMIYSLATRTRIFDLGSGLNLYAASFISDKFYECYTDGLYFNNTFLIGAIDRQAKLKFFPIHWKQEDQISNVRLFRQAIQTLWLALSYVVLGKAFLAKEHRNKIYASYDFDVLYHNAKN